MRVGFALVETAIAVGIESAIAFDLRSAQPGTAPISDPCPQAGSITLTLTDADSSGGVTAGDRIALSYAGCNDGDGVTNALLNIDVISIAEVGGEQRVMLRTAVANFTATFPGGTVTLSGGLDCEWRTKADADTFIVSGSEFVVAIDGVADTLRNFTAEYAQNYVAYEFVMSMSGEVAARSLNGIFSFATDVPYIGRLGWFPTAGAVTFRGAGNSAVRLEEGANGEGLGAEVGISGDFDGDGLFTYAGVSLVWATVTDTSFFEPVRADVPVPPESPGIHHLRGRAVPLLAGVHFQPIGDLQVDPARDRAYVSLADRNEVVVLSMATWQVIDRIGVGSRPLGMDLAEDGSALFVALHRGGGVAQLNPDTRQVTRIETAASNNSSQIDKVVETRRRLYVTPRFTGLDAGYLVEVDLAAGNTTKIVGGPLLAREAEMTTSNDGRFLYLAQRPFDLNGGSRLYKLDLALPDAPVVLTRDFVNQREDTTRLALSPDGQRLVLRSGEVLSTSDFSQIGRIPGAWAHAFSSDGTMLASLRAPSLFVLFDASTLVTRRTMALECPGDFDARLAHVSSRDQWVMTGGNGVCAFDLNDRLNPPGQPGGPPLPTDPQPVDLPVSVHSVLSAGGTGAASVAIDRASNTLYVAGLGTAIAEFAVFSLVDNTVVERVPLPSGLFPISLSLNDDGSRVFLGYAGANVDHIDVFDTATRTFSEPVPYPPALIDNAPGNGTGAVSDARWIGDNELLLGAMGNRVTPAAAVMLDVTNGAAFQIAGGQKKFTGDIMFHVTPDKTAALVTGRPGGTHSQRLERIDLVPDDPDVVAHRDNTELQGTDHAALSADGEVLYIRGGKAVNARTLMLVGQSAEGVPVPTPDNSLLYVLGSFDRSLRVFDAATFQLRAIYNLPGCGRNLIVGAVLASDPREIVYVRDTFVCRVRVPQS